MKDKKIFASGWCFDKIFIIFIICSIFGVFWEEGLYIIKGLIKFRTFMWSPRRGVLYGPFSPVYGAGAILMIFFLKKRKENYITLFINGFLLGGVFEYLVSFLQETFVGTVSWDYSNNILNIGGRTSVLYMISWGFLTVFLMKKIYPFINKNIEKIPYNIGKKISNLILVLFIFDALVSWSAILRWSLRIKNIKPITSIGVTYDRFFTDKYMEKHFPNMKIVK